jgi:hypothetical protein
MMKNQSIQTYWKAPSAKTDNQNNINLQKINAVNEAFEDLF